MTPERLVEILEIEASNAEDDMVPVDGDSNDPRVALSVLKKLMESNQQCREKLRHYESCPEAEDEDEGPFGLYDAVAEFRDQHPELE